MAKTQKAFGKEEQAHRALRQLKRRDLQRKCITMGIDFLEVVEFSNPQLESWFVKNYGECVIKNNRLDEFDTWYEKYLHDEVGYSRKRHPYMFHPLMKFGFVAERDKETGEIKKHLKPRKFKKEPKPKRERLKDLGNILSGTKKAYTYKLAAKGFPLKKVTRKVLKKFPDASEKSISIWYKKALKLANP